MVGKSESSLTWEVEMKGSGQREVGQPVVH